MFNDEMLAQLIPRAIAWGLIFIGAILLLTAFVFWLVRCRRCAKLQRLETEIETTDVLSFAIGELAHSGDFIVREELFYAAGNVINTDGIEQS